MSVLRDFFPAFFWFLNSNFKGHSFLHFFFKQGLNGMQVLVSDYSMNIIYLFIFCCSAENYAFYFSCTFQDRICVLSLYFLSVTETTWRFTQWLCKKQSNKWFPGFFCWVRSLQTIFQIRNIKIFYFPSSLWIIKGRTSVLNLFFP